MNDDYFISTDKILLNPKKIWLLLKNCFWSQNIPVNHIERFIHYSLCFGIYKKESNELVGFGRIISDYTTYAYISDVIVDIPHRRKGLARKLISTMLAHPELQNLKTWSLRSTEMSSSLYEEFGFTIANEPKTILEINNLEIYPSPHFINHFVKEKNE